MALAAVWLTLLVVTLGPLLDHLFPLAGPSTGQGPEVLVAIAAAGVAAGWTFVAGALWTGTGIALLFTRELIDREARGSLSFVAGVWAAAFVTLPLAGGSEWQQYLAPWLLLVVVELEGLRTAVTGVLRARVAPAN